MTADQTIQPLNVAGATLLIQLFFLGILAATASIHKWSANRQGAFEFQLRSKVIFITSGYKTSLLLLATIVSFAVLLVSDDFYNLWRPLFTGVEINTIKSSTSISIVFVMDIVITSLLIWSSGGTENSPFTVGLLTIPSLAIFLRESPQHFLTYAVVAALAYCTLLIRQRHFSEPVRSATAFMSMSCLALTMFTGYITRPVPINELKSSSSLAPSTAVEIDTPGNSTHPLQ